MELGLKNKPVIVMASGGGIGRGIARQFALEGARVLMFDRDEKALVQSKQIIVDETGREPLTIAGDITKIEDIERLARTAKDEFGTVYALVNNTGGPPAGNFDAFGDEHWIKAFELTLLGYIRVIRALLPLIRQGGGGRIVCNASSSIKQAIDNLILSNVFRMGVMGLGKSLARELGPENILVNVIGPGKIDTERVAYIDARKAEQMKISPKELRAQMEKGIPMRRYGTTEEIARLVVFLCSEANTFITGQNILVDGGMVAAY